MGDKFYAVKVGKNPGIYNTWPECQKQVIGYKGAKYKKFSTYEEANSFINDDEDVKEVNIDNLKENELIAYVDGSFDLKTKTYSYGVVLLSSDGKETYNGRETDKNLAEMRNVAGELKGAMIAMDKAVEKGKASLYLHYDYTGIENWAKGNWKTNKEGTKGYKKYYDSIKDSLNVVFIKVKAHSGVQYNEEADQLAKEAIIGDR